MPSRSLHEACYQGDVESVRAHLEAGADPNAPADPAEREWISAAGPCPRPLHCVALAWGGVTERHLEIARLLLERGARVDDTVIRDHTIEMVGHANDMAFRRLLGA